MPACALLLAPAAPEQAAAQTETTFISNTGQPRASTSHLIRSTTFTTGTGTYTLSSVAILLGTQSGSPTPLVQIYANIEGNRDTLVATLTNPGTLVDDVVNVFTAPANTTLIASTVYWVVTSNSANSFFGSGFRVATNTDSDTDSGTAAGWSIGSARYKTSSSGAWQSTSFRLQFQIRGTEGTAPTNNAPTFADTTLTRSIAENTAADANVGAVIPVATDTDSGDTLTYTMEGTDAASFNFNATTRQITTKAGVTYDFEAKSSYSVTIKVSDETDTDTVDVTITLTDVNEPPSAPAAPTVAATSGSTTSLDVSWTAPANSGKPAITSYDLQYRAGTSGSFTDGPQNVTGTSTPIASLNSGTSYQVQVRATNDEGDSGWSGSGNGSTSTPTNNPPVLANVIPDQTATAGTAFSYQVPANTFNDTDTGDTLSYTAMKADDTTLPTWLTFSAATRTFTGTPAAGNLGTVSVKVIATDTGSATVSDEFDIMVIPAAPAGLRAETGDGRVRLSWTRPTPQVDHAYRYAAGASVPAATAWTAVTSDDDHLSTVLISGLTNGTAHAFELRVVGSGGVSPGAAAAVSATPAVAACSAPNLGARRSVWSATLTVGRAESPSNHSAGYDNRQGNTPYGSLSPSASVSIGGTSYTIVSLETVLRSGDRRTMFLEFADALTFPDAVRTALRLHWCSDSSGFDAPTPASRVTDNNRAEWSIHTTREVALSLPANNDATGTPMVAGTAQAGETLTAGMGDIADADGLPATFPGDYAFQWVRVDADGTSNASDITNATANTYTLTADDVGKRVSVRVSFFDVLGGDEAILGALSNVVVSAVPGAPTGLTATASGSTTIDLSWTAPSSDGGSAITGYKIEVSSDSGSSWNNLVANTGNANTTYAHTGLAASATRHYRVSAINSNGTGSPSNVDNATTGTTVPGAPTSLSATASGSTAIDLSWSALASTGGSAITGYKIESSSDGGSSWNDLVADTGNANTTYVHSGLAAGNTRHYRVSAINANGASTHSNVANATTVRKTVTFNASSYTAEESGATAAVTVELSAVPSSAVTIPLVVTHLGGATTGDYEGLPSSVTFWTTGRSRTFRVRAIDDSNVDGGESVQIGFGTLPTGYAAGTHQTATVALVDDETELIVDFGTGAPSTPIYVRESDTDLHRITVTLRTSRYNAPDGNPQQPVTIPLVVTHRGGATPDDYEGLPPSVTFAVGESVTGFDMRAIPDRTSETGEGLRLDFGSLPSGVRKGSLGPYETIEFVDAAAAQANLSVAGSLLTLVYREAFDGASKPLPRDFVVTAQTPGGARTMVAVRAVSVRGSDVLLDLDRPVTPEETVTLTYLAAAMHPIRDAAGRLAPLLANEPVRNDTGADGPLEEKALADAAGLEAARDGAGTGHLDLSSRNLTDISALAGLTGVVELDLRDNAITDLWPLAGLTQLRVLNLRDNAITDLDPLAGLTGLQVLDLSGNQVADLWPLAGLVALERLNLSGNRVAGIATLAQLTGLRVVDLADNRVADLWSLAGLAALERLNLSDNRIEDIWPLASLSDLRVLLLDRNRVADLLALSHVAGLENLGLSGNRIEDVGWLAELGRLHRLDLSGNAVADVSALGDVSTLVWLRLSGNPVLNPYPLGRLQLLRWLWLNPGAAARMEALAPLAGQGEARLWIERVPAR